MENYFVLINDGFFYVDEHRASGSLNDAMKLESVNKIITTIPIMKDWNWDYKIGEIKDGKLSFVKDKEWLPEFWKWKEENPDEYKKLYKTDSL